MYSIKLMLLSYNT